MIFARHGNPVEGKDILSKLRVLVADDHEEIRQMVVRFLEREFEVIGAVADGIELMDAAALLNPDVIVSDVCMPRLTGPEALEKLTAKGSDIPFVFISASGNVVAQRAPFVLKDKLRDLVPAIQTAIIDRGRNR